MVSGYGIKNPDPDPPDPGRPPHTEDGGLRDARVEENTEYNHYLEKYLHIRVLTSGAMTENFGQKEGGRSEPEVRDVADPERERPEPEVEI